MCEFMVFIGSIFFYFCVRKPIKSVLCVAGEAQDGDDGVRGADVP